MNPLTFRPDQAWGELLLRWWRELAEDTGGRASLRRAPDITAVVLTPAFQRLHRTMRAAGWPDQPWTNDRLAAAAGLLAHVRDHGERTLPQAMSDGDKPVVSPLRFMRLLEAPDADALFTGLRRMLPLIRYRTDVLALATDVVNWGDAVKKRWAYTYDWPAKATS